MSFGPAFANLTKREVNFPNWRPQKYATFPFVHAAEKPESPGRTINTGSTNNDAENEDEGWIDAKSMYCTSGIPLPDKVNVC